MEYLGYAAACATGALLVKGALNSSNVRATEKVRLVKSGTGHRIDVRDAGVEWRSPPSPKHFPTKLMNKAGLLLQTYAWLPADGAKPRAVVFLVHGYGEHLGRYEHVAAALTAAGYAVFGIDHQGHGRSEGERAYVERWDDYADDVLQHVASVLYTDGDGSGSSGMSSFGTLPRFILGHSMGGAVAIRASMLSVRGSYGHACIPPQLPRESLKPITWTGVLLSGPCLVVNPAEATPTLRFLAKVLSGVLPKFGLAPNLGGSQVSRDPAVIESYDNDPLVYAIPSVPPKHFAVTNSPILLEVQAGAQMTASSISAWYHGRLRINWGYQLLLTTDQIQKETPLFKFPFLIMHGDADVLCMPEGSDKFFNEAGSTDKTCKHYPGLRHEIFNEPEKEEVFADVMEWIEARL